MIGDMPNDHSFLFLPELSHPFFYISLFLLIIHSPKADSDPLWSYCPTDANYTTNSSFQTNLNLLLTSLSSGAVATGYFNDSIGRLPPDQANGLALCRGDVSSTDCRACLEIAKQDIVRNCPVGKRSTIWYDHCLLRYSNQSFFGTSDTSFKFWEWNTNNASDPQTFDALLANLINSLATKAISDSSKLFAADEVNVTSFTKLYGLVQCTRDLSSNDCYLCLQNAIGDIPNCCVNKQGGKVYGQSCYLRFESYLFYNSSAVEPPPLPPPPPPPPPSGVGINATNGGNSKSSTRTALIVAIPVVSALVLLFLSLIWYIRRRKPATVASSQQNDSKLGNSDSLIFDLGMIRSATNNFSDENKLGEGGFGPVYKGRLPGGDQIAVKRLSRTSVQGIVEMKNEIILVTKLQHRNLAMLLGCCFDEDEKLLVYEYLPNTSLDKFLFDPIRREQLVWQTRYKIIEGIGRGLLYLHEESRLRIIHRDLKASNILLDGDMNPKISDFGLAKLFGVDETQGNTSRIAGTYGYMAPEYAMHGLLSTKSDVYSFGILILEIVSGSKNTDYQVPGLTNYVWQRWNQGMALDVLDRSLGNRFQIQEALRSIHVALLCIQEDPAERPSMATVNLMLHSYSTVLPVPSSPAFALDDRASSESGDAVLISRRLEKSDGSTGHRRKGSKNDLSISDIEPR